MRKSCLVSPGRGAGDIPFVPLFLYVLRLYGHRPSPRGRVPVNAYALSPPLCPISGARALCAEAGIGGRESLFHPSLYDVEAVLHLRFSSFCKK